MICFRSDEISSSLEIQPLFHQLYSMVVVNQEVLTVLVTVIC